MAAATSLAPPPGRREPSYSPVALESSSALQQLGKGGRGVGALVFETPTPPPLPPAAAAGGTAMSFPGDHGDTDGLLPLAVAAPQPTSLARAGVGLSGDGDDEGDGDSCVVASAAAAAAASPLPPPPPPRRRWGAAAGERVLVFFYTLATMRHKGVVLAIALTLFLESGSYAVVIPTLPAFIERQLHLAPSYASLIFSVYALGQFLAAPVLAWLSDRYHQRRILLGACLGLLAVVNMLFGMAETWQVVVIARFLQGVAGAGILSSAYSILADHFTDRSKNGRVYGLALTGAQSGRLLGPLWGGIAFAMGGNRLAFLGAAIAVVAVGILILFLLRDMISPQEQLSINEQTLGVVRAGQPAAAADIEVGGAADGRIGVGAGVDAPTASPQSPSPALPMAPPPQATTRPTRPSTTELYGRFLRDPTVLLMCFATVMLASIATLYDAIVPAFLSLRFGTSSSTLGLVVSVASAVGVVSSPASGVLADYLGKKRVLVVGFPLVGLLSALVGFAPVEALAFPAFFVRTATWSALASSIFTLLASAVDRSGTAAYAQVYSIYLEVYAVGIVLGPLLVFALLRVVSPAVPMLVIALAIAATGAVLALFLQNDSAYIATATSTQQQQHQQGPERGTPQR